LLLNFAKYRDLNLLKQALLYVAGDRFRETLLTNKQIPCTVDRRLVDFQTDFPQCMEHEYSLQ